MAACCLQGFLEVADTVLPLGLVGEVNISQSSYQVINWLWEMMLLGQDYGNYVLAVSESHELGHLEVHPAGLC